MVLALALCQICNQGSYGIFLKSYVETVRQGCGRRVHGDPEKPLPSSYESKVCITLETPRWWRCWWHETSAKETRSKASVRERK